MKKILIYITPILFVAALASCDKLVEIPKAKNQVETSAVFADSAAATSALLGIYFTLGTATNATQIYNKNLALYSDELTYTSSLVTITEFNQSSLSNTNSQNASIWNSLYSAIYQSNALIEGVDGSASISESVKRLLKGEAKFLRAFSNFYLVNLYGRVPLLLTTNVDQNRRAKQSEPQDVYSQIIKDLQEAKSELGVAYIGTGKVRANKWAASAMLARVYLYQEKWNEAEKEAETVIQSGLFSPLPALENVFVANSKEAILQFWSANGFVSDATTLIPASSTVLPQYTMSEGLFQSFDLIDGRRAKWMGTNTVTSAGVTTTYNYPFKYKNRIANTTRPEFLMAIRLTEMYLIRAEAKGKQNDISSAVSDLNLIRSRAGGIPTLPINITFQQCIDAIAKERRQELFGEWGHRFFDLKRTSHLDAVLGHLKSTWRPNVSNNLPIPNTEIVYNSNLVQNYGY